MKAATFEYVRPRDVAEAMTALAQAGGTAKLLAGGQSLGPMLNLRLARPQLLLDIARVEALRAIEEQADAWRIGAAVTHARLEDGRGTRRGAEMLCRVAAGIAYRSVRNRGTIGGSMAHADPAADWPLALAALGASINVTSVRGGRAVPADEFVRGAFTTTLGEDEIIETVLVPKLSSAARYGYYKYCRKTGEFAEAAAAAVFDPAGGIARVFLGAPASAPRPLPDLAREAAQTGRVSREAIATSVALITPELDSVGRRMAGAAVSRALARVFGQ